MRLYSWNVNGIRAAHKKGFLDWLDQSGADVVAIQETKARPDQLDEEVLHPKKYNSYWHSAEKAGYSGVAIYSKKEPIKVQEGFQKRGSKEFDSEGRVIIAEYSDFTLINAYFPNSQREHKRLPYKLGFCKQMLKYCDELRKEGKNLVLCGDLNIAHKPIDLKNPKTNEKNAGYLPEERAWMDEFTSAGYVDTFRHFESGPDHYTWWSYRPGVREKNIGWRLDYHCINEEFKDRLKASKIHPDVMGSDHCPVRLEIKP